MAQKFTAKQDASLLNFLFESYPETSRTTVKGYLTNGRVLVNGQKVTAFDWLLHARDRVEIIPKGASIANEMKSDAVSDLAKKGIEILYEDQHLIVVTKRAGLPTISPKTGQHEANLYSMLMDYMHTGKVADRRAAGMSKKGRGKQIAADPEAAAVVYRKARVFVVHRLDRDTSGVLVFAKDERTKDLLQSKWNDMVLERRYVAVVEGHPQKDEGRIETWLTENEKSLKMMSSPTDNGGMRAVTYYRVVEKMKNLSLMEFELETGRKNQIRVHTSSVLGCPIVGDEKYGSSSRFVVKAPNNFTCRRIALHAKTLVFRHPFGDEVLSFDVPIPEEFAKLK